MAYTLIKSNSLETIISCHAKLFQSASILSLGSYIVTQNNQSATYLKYRLADHLSISADHRIVLPESALRHLIEGFPFVRGRLELDQHGLAAKPPLHANEVKLVIYQYLKNHINTKKELKAIKSYIKGKNDDDSITLLYQLSKSLADLFISYGMNAPDMVGEWASNQDGNSTEENALQWQAFLWQELFSIEHNAPYTLLSDLMRYVTEHNEAYDGPESTIILIGSSFLGEGSLRFFKYISRMVNLTHFFITPTKALTTSSDFIKDYTVTAQDFERYQKMLYSEKLFSLVENYQSYSLETSLSKIQDKIFSGHSAIIDEIDDSSFKIYVAPSLKREVEMVKDYIITALERDKELKCQEIAIIAPDINHYASYIEAHFTQEEPAIPSNIVDLAFTDDLSQSFLLLLELSSSRFSRSALFTLFSLEPFKVAQNITDEEYNLWLRFCDQANVLWAFDHEHRLTLELGKSPLYSWQHAFNRFLSSLTIGNRSNKALNFDIGNENSWPSLGKLMHLITELYQGFGHLSLKNQPFDAWENEMEGLMIKFLKSDNDSVLSLKRIFRNMREAFETAQEFKPFSDKNFSFSVIKSYFKESATIGERRKGEFLRGGVVCSSLKPVRSIPFKVIIMLGLDGEHFPSVDHQSPSYDLQLERIDPPLFSQGRRDSDRYAFIESLMAARHRLALFYQGRHEESGMKIEASVALEELLAFINPHQFSQPQSHPSPWLSSCYPLHSFSKQLFTPSLSYLHSYNTTAFNLAQSYYRSIATQPTLLRTNTQRSTDQPIIVIDININDLISFFTDPSSYLFTRHLKCSPYQSILLEDIENEADELDFRLKNELATNLKKEIFLGKAINFQQLLDKETALWHQKGDLNNGLLSPKLNKKSYQQLTIFYNMTDCIYHKLNRYQAITYTINDDSQPNNLTVDNFIINQCTYRLTGSLTNMMKYEDKLAHVTTLLGNNQLKMVIPSFFYRLSLSCQHYHYQQLESYCLNFDTLYSQTLPLKQEGADERALLDFAITVFIRHREQPLPFFPAELNKNEMRSANHKYGWQTAYRNLCEKKEYSLSDRLLYPHGIGSLTAEMDKVFNLIYQPLLHPIQ